MCFCLLQVHFGCKIDDIDYKIDCCGELLKCLTKYTQYRQMWLSSSIKCTNTYVSETPSLPFWLWTYKEYFTFTWCITFTIMLSQLLKIHFSHSSTPLHKLYKCHNYVYCLSKITLLLDGLPQHLKGWGMGQGRTYLIFVLIWINGITFSIFQFE